MPYFHASRVDLPIGTVIAPYRLQARIPDAWLLLNDEVAAGPVRAMRALRAIHRDWASPQKGSSFIEVVAERIRAKQFNGLPSRMDCSFAMRSLEAARAYSLRYQGGQHFFEVEPVDNPRIWFADIDTLSHVINLDPDPGIEYQAVVDRITAYWGGFNQDPPSIGPRTEALIEGSIRVVGPCLAPNRLERTGR